MLGPQEERARAWEAQGRPPPGGVSAERESQEQVPAEVPGSVVISTPQFMSPGPKVCRTL